MTKFWRPVFAALLAISLSGEGLAHEFWLEPANYSPQPGESVPIKIVIGQNFKGNSYPFIREEYKKFIVIDATGERPVKGVDGDDPAIKPKFSSPGLVVFAHYSTPEPLDFETWEKFEAYLKMEGLEHIAPLHKQRGKPVTGIRESYSRCAKLLMNIGKPGGNDRLTGMPLELLAERNPYSLAAGEKLPVRLFFNGKPIQGIQVTAFSRSEPDQRQHVRTDAAGRAVIDLTVSGPWLLNAVHMMEPAPQDKAHWSSLWASLTFARP